MRHDFAFPTGFGGVDPVKGFDVSQLVDTLVESTALVDLGRADPLADAVSSRLKPRSRGMSRR